MGPRRFVVGIAAALGALLVTGAPARAESTHWIGYQAGLAVPSGPFADVVRQGFGGGIGYHWIANRSFGLGGDLVYHRWRITDARDRAFEVAYGTGVVAKLTNVDVTVHAIGMLPLRGRVRPFALAGGGLYCTRDGVRLGAAGDDMAGNHFGVSGGMGLQFDANRDWNLRLAGVWNRFEDDASVADAYTALSAQLLWRIPWGSDGRW